MAASYTAKDILVLEGLEPVRRRPGMYIGGVDATGLHHLLWEIVDNSVDEAMNGHADRITVTLHKDGASVTVTDNGRGIPVDLHPQYKKPALELILTTLHAGGKFEAKNYYHSGGLHGVGASVVNALSREAGRARASATAPSGSRRSRAARPTGPLKKLGAGARQRHDHLLPPRSRDLPEHAASTRSVIAERLEAKAYLHGGLTIEFARRGGGHDEHLPLRGRPRARTSTKIVARDAAGAPLARRDRSRIQKEQDELHVECALAWTEDTSERVLSFVNGIPTTSGGAHENGLRAAS